MLLRLLPTGNRDSLTELNTPKFTVTTRDIKSSHFTSCCLIVAFNIGSSLFSGFPNSPPSLHVVHIILLVNSIYIISIFMLGGIVKSSDFFLESGCCWQMKDKAYLWTNMLIWWSIHIRACQCASFGLMRHILLHQSVNVDRLMSYSVTDVSVSGCRPCWISTLTCFKIEISHGCGSHQMLAPLPSPYLTFVCDCVCRPVILRLFYLFWSWN